MSQGSSVADAVLNVNLKDKHGSLKAIIELVYNRYKKDIRTGPGQLESDLKRGDMFIKWMSTKAKVAPKDLGLAFKRLGFELTPPQSITVDGETYTFETKADHEELIDAFTSVRADLTYTNDEECLMYGRVALRLGGWDESRT
jgi:hypothetical protein